MIGASKVIQRIMNMKDEDILQELHRTANFNHGQQFCDDVTCEEYRFMLASEYDFRHSPHGLATWDDIKKSYDVLHDDVNRIKEARVVAGVINRM